MTGCIVPISVVIIIIVGWVGFFSSIDTMNTTKQFSVHHSTNGWWSHIEGDAYPFGAWRMDRGPYLFKWMAQLDFPIERVTKDGPRR